MRTAQLGLGLVACVLGVSAFAEPLPPEAYGRLPAIGDAAISPDGKHVAVIVNYEYHANEPKRDLSSFRIINIDTGAIEQTVATEPGNTLRGVGWANEKQAFYNLSAKARVRDLLPSSWPVQVLGSRIEFFRTVAFSLDTSESRVLMGGPEFRTNTAITRLYAPLENEPGFARMIAWGGAAVVNPTPRLAVYRVNLQTGNAVAVTSGNALTRGYMVDERGDVVARVDINERSDRWQLYTYENGHDRLLLEDVSEMGMPLALFGLLPDGRIAAADPHENGARDTLLAIDRKTGAREPLHSTHGSDVGTVADSWSHRIVGIRWTEELPKQEFFDQQLQSIAATMQSKFADGYALLAGWSQDRARILVYAERADDAGAYYIYEPAAQKLRILGKRYPALNNAEHWGVRKSIQFPARDGTRIPAYLTTPAGVEAKNLPLVLLVHGGPHARDDFTFNWWASFLASRGFAVLQPNFRGSTGYGYEWFDAGRGNWGDGVMQTDVEDGVVALVKSGIVDSSRVCIMGGSYGGYAALAGATLTPERYACAVSVNGLSDPERMLDDASSGTYGGRGMAAEWWRRSMGEDKKHLRKISPIEHADAVRVPILLLHAVEDSVVPVEQSRTMARRLRSAHKNVRYVELPGDDHWLSFAQTRTQMLREVESFLTEEIGGGAASRTTK